MLEGGKKAGVENPTLQGDEIADILQFLVSLRYFEPTGSPLLGERIFAERGCALCHGPAAQGTNEGPKLRAEGDPFTTVSLATAFWSHGAAMGTRAEQLGITWPTLQATDIGDLISFLNAPAK